jgi:hypothetical protein
MVFCTQNVEELKMTLLCTQFEKFLKKKNLKMEKSSDIDAKKYDIELNSFV